MRFIGYDFIQTRWLSLSNSHSNVASIQKNQGDKSHCVMVAFGPVTILLRFHFLFTRKRWRRSWKRKHLNTQTKVDRFENATIWKRNDLKRHPCNRGLSSQKVCYKNLIHCIKCFPCTDLNEENSLSRKPFTSAMRYAIQTSKLHLFGREKTIF